MFKVKRSMFTRKSSSVSQELSPLPEKPLISVIIPSYNQGRFIRETIESCLQQDYRPIEILVMDGASTDETVDVLKSYGDIPELKWVSEPDDGPVDAVNKGLSVAQGQICLIQSADDVSCPDAFCRVVDTFLNTPDLVLVYGDCRVMDVNGQDLHVNRVGLYTKERLFSRQTYVPQPTAFFRLCVARESGGWDARFPYCPDTELWFKLALRGKVLALPVILGACRRHPGQRDAQRSRILESYSRMIAESPALQNVPWRYRRALQAGCLQLELKYGAGCNANARCWHLWKAICLYPPLLFSRAIPKHCLLPGYFRLAALHGQMKRVVSLSFIKKFLGEYRLAWQEWPEQWRKYRQFPKGRPIVLVGAPRSGTTWVAAMLSVPGIWHLHEPFNPNQGYWHEAFTHIPIDSQNKSLDHLIDKIRRGGCRKTLHGVRVANRGMPLRLFPVRYQRMLLKDPIACLMAAYVAKKLDGHLLVLFRHPAAVVQSYYGLRWPSACYLLQFLATPSLMRGALAPYDAMIRSASEKEGEESVAMLYACLCKILWKNSEDDPSVIRLQYETLAKNPMQGFRDLYEKLGLPYTNSEEDRHRALTSESGREQGIHGVMRDSRKTAEKWRQTIDPVVLKRIRGIWNSFEIPLYQHDEDWFTREGSILRKKSVN